MSGVDALLSSLLAIPKGPKGPRGPLIAEVGEPSPQEAAAAVPHQQQQQQHEEEGPSLMEMMMAEQAAAAKAKRVEDIVVAKKEAKGFGSGFKKGFFGLSSSSTGGADAKASKLHVASSSAAKPRATAASNSSEPIIPTLRKRQDVKGSLLLDEVQVAMRDDNPMLNQLRQGEWVTPDLTAVFAANTIIAAGMRNPKCMTAMQLMQSNPEEAKTRYMGDPEVDVFLREFGRVMSSHFETLGAQQHNSSSGSGSISDAQQPRKIVEEVGPLQAEALRKAKQVDSEDESRVREVLDDPELRELLMDPHMQQVLQECGDPVKFQKHMRDPVTAYRIQRLYKAGLVGTAT